MEDVRRNDHHDEVATGPSRGSAVQIINVKTLPNAPSRFILEKAPFRQILSEVGKRPIYLLSIAGASRQGKSFLMNVILHYMEELEKSGCGVDPWDRIASLHSLDGFHIENRNVRDTIGFWMWSKPFVFKQSNGQEIAILLMDTQGVFDKFSTKKEWGMIVGLSLLTSSCLIYNLLNNLQEDNLEIFTNFAEFGMLSLQGNENATSVFQKLLFLIRDWGFPNDNPYGSVGGSTFIHEQLKVVPEMPEELRKVRKTLTNVFEEINCFLLPHPGNAAKENNYRGSLRPLEPVFLKNLKSFLENLIIIDELKPLHIGGNPVTGWELMAYFSKYIELLNGQKIAKPVSLHDATVEANLDSIVEDCVSFVRKAVDEAMTEFDFIPLEELKVICERYTHQGIDIFKQKVVGQESRQVSKYCGALTDDLTVLMDGYAKRNQEMKTAYILKLLDIAEVAFEKKVADSVNNMTHSEQDFEEILEKCKEEVVDKVKLDFGDRNEDFFTEVMPQVRAVFSKLDERYRQTNSDRLQTVEANYKKCFDDLLSDYDDRMETAVPDDELDSITPVKLAKSHERCEQRIVTQFLAGMKFDNENIQRKAVADLKAQTAARLAKKSKKVEEIAQNSSNEALQILEKSLKRYHDGMAALLKNERPTDAQIQEKHELQRMMAETEFSSVVYVVKSREESNRLRGLFESKIQEELESIQSQVQKQREKFRSRWNGHVDEAGKKYSDLMNRMLDSPKISSDSELKAHHKKLIEIIVREAAQDSWIPSESKEEIQSDVRQRLMEKSRTFFNQHERLIQEAEESAKTDICLFTKSHEKALKDRINSGKDSITEEEFKRLHERLVGERKVLFESKWSQRLPKNSLVKVIDDFVNGGDGVFSINMKTVQSLVRDKMKGIREIIKDCCETYELDLDDKMDCANNSGDLGVLEKYHKSAKMKAEKEFKKAMKEYASFPKAEEMKSELEKEIVRIFEKKKESLEESLIKLAQGMGDLGNSALEFYHKEMGNRKTDVSSEEGLRAAHKEVLEGAIKQFERNVAGTLGNLTVAKLQDEKNKLEERLAEELPMRLKDLNALTASRLSNKSKKVQEIAQSSSSEALEILEKAMKSYQDGMAALLKNERPTDAQIQEKHELQRMMAETEFSSVVYVVKSREESSRLKNLLERKIQEELESIQSQVRKQRELFTEKTSHENPSALEIVNGIISKTDPLKMYDERLKNMKLSSINFSQVVCVPEEFTKKPIRNPASMYENAFGSESQRKQHSPSTLSSDSRDKMAKDAFMKANCGNSGNKSILNQPLPDLGDKLVDLHEQNKMQLKERLETNKIRTVLVRNLVSRYESELDRSAVRNPAISTTEQFNEMSNNYRNEANRKFEESLKPLSSFEVKEELRQAMDSELNKVFRVKQEEFNKKKRVASFQDLMESEEETENAQSQSQIPAQVGIHFGFDFLSAVALVDGSPRTVYGPSPNTISFESQNDSFIGETLSSSAKETLSFSRIFKNLDMSTRYYVSYGKYCRIEELVALVLAHLHRAVGRSLHTNNIAYVIAFPSCFNQPARRAMNYAVQIAGLNAKMVRDTCGLTAYFIKELYVPVFANSFQHLVLTIVENDSDEFSDVIGYELRNQVVSPVFLCGFYPPSWSYSTPLTVRSSSKPGLSPLVEKLQKNSVYMTYKKIAIRVILHCSGSNQERNMNIIKAAMPGVKVHFYPSNTINTKYNLTVGKGAALLAGYKFNPKFSQDWDRDHPEITLRGFDQDINKGSNRNYRMIHSGSEMRSQQVSELSQKVQFQVAAYHRSLEVEKSRGKTVYMEVSNEIQDSNMKQSDKNRISRDLSALLKELDEEELYLSRFRDIIDRMKNL
jgi:atlastin